MGNLLVSDEKYGKINIWTEKAKYIAGEQVNGLINLNIIENFPSNELYLIIEGEEKAKVIYSFPRNFYFVLTNLIKKFKKKLKT
jgi:hypothetical protein